MASIKRLLPLVFFWFAGCLPAAGASGGLPFATIEQKRDAAYIGQQQYNALDPGLLVILDDESRDAAGDLFSESARRQIGGVNLETHFLVAVFQGWQPSGGYGVSIESVRVEGETVRITAAFTTPGGEDPPGVTSPYHLVSVRRPVSGLAAGAFELVAGERVLAVFPTPAAP